MLCRINHVLKSELVSEFLLVWKVNALASAVVYAWTEFFTLLRDKRGGIKTFHELHEQNGLGVLVPAPGIN